jgi:hypothetical protein
MYDFYNNPPKTREDIYNYIISWLENTNDFTVYEINNQRYVNEKMFRRAFCIHSVFKNLDTNEYIWYVTPDTNIGTFNDFPQVKYETYESLIENVVNDYYILWLTNNTN